MLLDLSLIGKNGLIDPRRRRSSLLQPDFHRGDLVGAPLQLALDGAVGRVHDPAAEPKFVGLLLSVLKTFIKVYSA